MAAPNKNKRIAKDNTFATAFDEFCSKRIIHVDGQAFKGAALAEQFRAHAELEKACEVAYAKWRQLVAEEREARAELAPIVAAVASTVTNVFGVGSEAYNAFGIVARKVGKKSVATKALAIAKLRATREARHTMGKRQKASIVGTVGGSASQPTAAPPSDAPAASAASAAPANANANSVNTSSH